jgi:hypothetical protein
MHRRGKLQRGVLLAAAVTFLVAAYAGKSAKAEITTALVPMYTYPGIDPASWTDLDQSANKIHIDAIINPNNGPGTFTDTNYVAAIANLDATKYGKAYGYIKTGFGGQSLSAMEADVRGYLNLYGGKNFAGFFLDQMSILPSTLSTYQQLYTYIKTLPGFSFSVIGNPGSPFLNGVSPTDFMSTADQLVIFEGPNTAPGPFDPGFDNYPYGLPQWFRDFPSSRIANIIHDVPADSGDPTHSAAMLSDLSKAQGLNAGSIFVTDGTGGNPYDHLPSYWDQEVALIALNTPEPSSLLVATACGIVATAIAALRSRRRDRNLRNGG